MAVLPLKQIVPGMVLAQDVVDLSGRLLLNRNSVITEKYIKIFKTWGVSEVIIKEQQEEGSSQPCKNPTPATSMDSQRRQQAETLACQLFPINHHPLHRLILACATRAIYRRLERGERIDVY